MIEWSENLFRHSAGFLKRRAAKSVYQQRHKVSILIQDIDKLFLSHFSLMIVPM